MTPRDWLATPGWLWRWCGRHRRWVAAGVVLAAVVWLTGHLVTAVLLVGLGLLPGMVAAIWVQVSPVSYERWVAGPARRRGWRRHLRRQWIELVQDCGLVRERNLRTRGRLRTQLLVPRLGRVSTRGHVVTARVRARPGQTVEELTEGCARLATTLGAVAYRVYPAGAATVALELVMRDALTHATAATVPESDVVLDAVRLGRAQGGDGWWLPVRGRHTLVAGCSGSGKGSVLWGICGGLAPAVRADLVRLWGIDLKRGVELAMGEGLFTTRAYTPAEAVKVLRALLRVIDERGAAMVGHTRLHEPTVGDPLHVLVIDELAALTAYADVEVRREANRLLAEILTQGRALGVVVLACVQDPRKDVVSTRGLFTQTVALRLRSIEETAMVLGDGAATVAPAHRISPAAPGTAWVVEDTGAADRVRADYWPDDLVRDVAGRYPAPVATALPEDIGPDLASRVSASRPTAASSTAGSTSAGSPGGSSARPRQRSPRKPRTPRATAATREEGAA